MTEIDLESVQKFNEAIRQATDSLLIMNGMVVRAAQVIDALTAAIREQCVELEEPDGDEAPPEMGDCVK